MIEKRLSQGELKELFIEHLGWDRAGGTEVVVLPNERVTIRRIAQKRGFQVFELSAERYLVQTRRYLRAIQQQVARIAHEHILIAADPRFSVQVWMWAYRDPKTGKLRHREHPIFRHRISVEFVDRLHALTFRLDEEDRLNLSDVTGRVSELLDDGADQEIFFRRPGYAKESDRLARAIQNGGIRELHEFVTFHRRLARWFAKKRYRWVDGHLDDVAQIAAVGLMKAARAYDPDHGTAFSTYAYKAMQTTCQREVPSLLAPCRVAHTLFWRDFRYFIKQERIETRYGPTHAGDARKWDLRCRTFPEPIEAARAELMREWRSIDDSEDSAWNEALLLPHQTDAILDLPEIGALSAEDISGREMWNVILDALDNLDPRKRFVIRHRFAIDTERMTLQEIGNELRLTKERVRQLEMQGLKDLRQSVLAKCGLSEAEIDAFESELLDKGESKANDDSAFSD